MKIPAFAGMTHYNICQDCTYVGHYQKMRKNMKNIEKTFLGIDLGSRFVKLVYGESAESFICQSYETIDFYKNYCSRSLDCSFFLHIEKIKKEGFTQIVSTGYGRNLVSFKNATPISEIVAHFFGAKEFLQQSGEKTNNFTVLDIGGQDTKIITVKNGLIDDFYMNDKCAAGSGRYLENMSKILGLKIDEIGTFVDEPIKLSNTCAIFGESEIISCIVQGIPVERIAAGVNYSIFSRVKSHLAKLSKQNELIIFVGGVANNSAIKKYISGELNKRIIVPENNKFNGALGCFYNAIKNR